MRVVLAKPLNVAQKAQRLDESVKPAVVIQREWDAFKKGVANEFPKLAKLLGSYTPRFNSRLGEHAVVVKKLFGGTNNWFAFWFTISLSDLRPDVEVLITNENYSSESIVNVNGGHSHSMRVDGAKASKMFCKQLQRYVDRWEHRSEEAVMLKGLVDGIFGTK